MRNGGDTAGHLYRGGPAALNPAEESGRRAAAKTGRFLSRTLFCAAFFLLLLSLYELLIRLDDLRGEVRMVSHMVRDGRLTWTDFLTGYMWDLRTVPAVCCQLLCALVSLLAMILGRFRRACAFLMIPAVLLAAWGFLQPHSFPAGWLRGLRLLMGALLALLCVMGAFVRPRRRKLPPRPGKQKRSPVLQDGRTAVPRREIRRAPAPLQDNRPKNETLNTSGGNDR